MMVALTQGGNVIATINLIIISRRFKVNMMHAKANFYPYGATIFLKFSADEIEVLYRCRRLTLDIF
jgi:hypothetical protein